MHNGKIKNIIFVRKESYKNKLYHLYKKLLIDIPK